MKEFRTGSKIVPKSSFSVQNIYTIYALGEPGPNGYPAWVKFGHGHGQIIDLEYYKLWFEPGYFRLKLHPESDVKFFRTEPNDLDSLYERVQVIPVDEED